MSFEGRVAVVTGGTGALGRAVVKHLLSHGAAVHVPWIVESQIAELEEHLGSESSSLRLMRADLSREQEVEQLFAEVEDVHGRLDILCNLAGGFVLAPLTETTLAEWLRMMAMNVTTAFVSCRVGVPLMRSTGGGRIINVTAMPALERGAAQMSAYAASKAAILNLTQSLAKELAADHITANAIAPTIIDTEANRRAMPEADRSSWLMPEEIAEVIAFLASDAGAVVTGSVLALAKSG